MNFNSGDKINNTNNNCHHCLSFCTIFWRYKSSYFFLFPAQFQKYISSRTDVCNGNLQETTRHLTHFEPEKKTWYDERKAPPPSSRVFYTRFQNHKCSHYIMFTKSGTCCGRTPCHVLYLWVLLSFQAYTAFVEPKLLGKPPVLP